MTKQRRQSRRNQLGKMSFVERAGLLFGIVGLLADGAFLFSFATGISNLHDYIPKSVPTSSGESFFALVSGLFLIYGWFALSWYLVRRSFVLLGQLPLRFDRPLTRRTTRTVIGLGVITIPLAIAWSMVNLPDSYIREVGFTMTEQLITVTRTPSSINQTVTVTQDPSITETPMLISVPIPEKDILAGGRTQYYAIVFPFYIILIGFIVWLPIILLMPIVHVELLLGDNAPSILDELREMLEEENG